MYLLGIDIGTSACKIAVFDSDFNLVEMVTKPYEVYYPNSGWAEQNPNEWWNAVCAGIGELTVPLDKVEGIGIDGQGWSCIPIDKNGEVLHNTPIWFDTRATAECAEIQSITSGAKILTNAVNPSYTTPKVLWFKKNMPKVYENARYFLQSNSFIAYKLTGIASQDKSQGYAHYFYDLKNCSYDGDLAREMGIDIAKFPQIYDCFDVVGTITEAASRETGLKVGTPVIAGGLDAACGTLGVGVFKSGQTQEQGGQAGGMSICVDEPKFHEKLILGNHVLPNLWLLQGGTVGGGASMKWFSEQFGNAFVGDGVLDVPIENNMCICGSSGTPTPTMLQNIDNEASQAPAGSDGLTFLPYLAGERSPVWNPNAKGVYFGITFDKSRGHFARATMEGVAYSLLHNLETAAESGASVDVLRAMGGASNSRIWTQIKADVTGRTVEVPGSDAATCLGAVLLAGMGIGLVANLEDTISKIVKVKRIQQPNPANFEAYRKGYKTYIELYKRLEDLM